MPLYRQPQSIRGNKFSGQPEFQWEDGLRSRRNTKFCGLEALREAIFSSSYISILLSAFSISSLSSSSRTTDNRHLFLFSDHSTSLKLK